AFASEYRSVNRFTYAENFVAQWASEWGVPVTLLLLAVFGYSLMRAMHRARSPDRLGAIAGLVAFAAQNLVDLGFELLGVATVAGALFPFWASDGVKTRARGEKKTRRAALSWTVVCVLLAVFVALALPIQRDHVAYLEHQLEDRMRAGDHA